ncbi:uncharacterized protein EV154DRAFT_442545 [Mucor mucedo]|uniref:uncharacterized protein n=1 Tax=Mucor mucedo TaxID=29922 RepID=UPI00221FF96B|nr:uncharacterized protein EV154DRAFT_442545 [Mucor mucedo]KAI7891734.1 hypothetical protein EV154DRAFT_442545 [Mucor mucedo]
MAKDSTEMDDMDISINQRNTDRVSWNSFTSEDSNAQTTLYSPTQFNHTINNSADPKNQLLQNNTYSNSRAPSITSRKHTLLPLSSDQPNEEVLEELPTSSSSSAPPPPATPQTPFETPAVARPSIFSRFMASLPVFAQMRKTIKAAVALLIGTVFIFESKTRAASGSSMLLVPIVVIFYFPVRTIGIQTEAVLLGTLGGFLAALWSLLGTYLASLARDHTNPNPIQIRASVVLAVFLFLGTFVLNLIRMKIHKANFAAVIACIVLSFTMTYGAASAPFVPEITWLFLRPIALAGAISLLVDYLLWPDDSVNNFLGILRKTLGGYNLFFKEHSDAFLSLSADNNGASLPNLNARLQNGVLLMIDCKRAVKREIIYSRISDKDCSALSSVVKNMRISLHGVGLSLIIKNNYLNSDTKNMYFKNFKIPSILEAFSSTVESIQPICSELTDICFKATNQGSGRIGNLHYHARTTLNSILWPFPRLWVSKTGAETQPALHERITSQQIQQVLDRFEIISKSDKAFFKFLELNPADIPRNGPLYLIFLYIHNLKEHASNTVKLLELIESLETKRTHSRFWFPHQTLKKWLFSQAEVGAAVGADIEDYSNGGGNDLARISTRQDGRGDNADNEGDIFQLKTSDGKPSRNQADPDVSAPVTRLQKFFNYLYIFGAWLTDTDTFFAFKTSVGVVLLAIPAWRSQDALWYMNWRGQWTMITLVLWMFPMTGAFLFGLIDRVAGSIVGCIAGIVIWEICQGNPYGMTFVFFIFFLPMYHVFFFVPKYRVGALMTKITALLVVSYEYTYTVDGSTSYDKVWTVAGKRLVMVLVGIIASGILIAIPFPPTSRVELRKNVAHTIRDIGKAFGILCASAIAPLGQRAHPVVVKAFGKLALELRRQVAEERILLHHASYEPPLRGYFPAASYAVLVEKMDNMSDLVINMGSSLHQVRPEWRRNIGSILMKERKEYLSSILTILKLLSSTLSAKTSLPPYMMSPIESRQRFVNLLEKKIMIEPKDLADPSFPSYSAYLMNSLVFVDELQVLLNSIEELVGVENPEEWLMAQA